MKRYAEKIQRILRKRHESSMDYEDIYTSIANFCVWLKIEAVSDVLKCDPYLVVDYILKHSHRHRIGCEGKKTYPNRKTAKQHANRRRTGHKPYRCRHCEMYHLTSQTGSPGDCKYLLTLTLFKSDD